MNAFASMAPGIEAGYSVAYPAPSGRWAVGRTVRHWTDDSRRDSYDSGDFRQLTVYLWYPAAGEGGDGLRQWLPATHLGPFATALSTPVDALSRIGAHARDDAPPLTSNGPRFVVILSHGDGGHPLLYTAVAEELASHGYLVAGVTHTHNAIVTLLPGGREAFRQAAAAVAAGTRHSRNRSSEEIWQQGTRALQVWVNDLTFVRTRLEELQRSDPGLAGLLNLSRIGLLGHSFGGAAVTEAMQVDDRFAAAINMDGDLFGDYPTGVRGPWLNLVSVEAPLPQAHPFVLRLNGLDRESFERRTRRLHARRQAFERSTHAYYVTLRGAEHSDFSDIPLLWPLIPEALAELDPLDPGRTVLIVNDFVLAFFDLHLRGERRRLLEGAPVYPEALLEATGVTTGSALQRAGSGKASN